MTIQEHLQKVKDVKSCESQLIDIFMEKKLHENHITKYDDEINYFLSQCSKFDWFDKFSIIRCEIDYDIICKLQQHYKREKVDNWHAGICIQCGHPVRQCKGFEKEYNAWCTNFECQYFCGVQFNDSEPIDWINWRTELRQYDPK